MLAALLLMGLLPFAAMPLFEPGGKGDGDGDGNEGPSPERETPRVDLPDPAPETASPPEGEGDAVEGDLLLVDAAAGDQVLDDFVPGLDGLEIDLTMVDGEIYFDTGAGAEGAVLALSTGAGAVMTVQFPGLEEVPARDILLRLVDEASGEVYALDLAEAQEDDETPPWHVDHAKPVLDTTLPVVDDFPFERDGEAEVLDPVDPELRDEPGPEVEGEVLEPVDPDTRDAPGPEVEGEVLDPVEPLTPPGPEDAALVKGFVAGEDRLQLSLERPGDAPYTPDVTVAPSKDGADGLVRVDGALVAVLQGAPEATLQDVETEVLPPPANP